MPMGTPLRLRFSNTLLQSEQVPLAPHPPAITTRIAILAHHAMARNCNSDRIARTRARHGPRRFRPADLLGNLAVASGIAVRDVPELLPDQPLESGGLNVERQRLPVLAANASLNGVNPLG